MMEHGNIGTPLEKDIEAALTRRVEELGGLSLKFIPDLEEGMPDRVLLLPGGRVVWVELKRGKLGRVSAMQTYQHRRLRSLGQEVHLIRSVADIEDLLPRT